ncbi:MAG: argininosuccinate synthase, partial [Acidilobaceae archaeon]
AMKHGIPVKEKIYSIDENLWGRSIESGVLEDPRVEPPEEVFGWTLPPEKAPDTPAYIEIGFEKGVPVSINGEKMDPVRLISLLNKLAGLHGVGRIDIIENRVLGLKSREIYEAPGAVTIITAHKDLERLVLTKRMFDFKEIVDSEWARLVYQGLWFDTLRLALDVFIDKAEEVVTGNVKVKLHKGVARVVGRWSEYSLYDEDLVSYFKNELDQKLAVGFIEFFGLQSSKAFRKLVRE